MQQNHCISTLERGRRFEEGLSTIGCVVSAEANTTGCGRPRFRQNGSTRTDKFPMQQMRCIVSIAVRLTGRAATGAQNFGAEMFGQR